MDRTYGKIFKVMLPIIAAQMLIVAVGFVDSFMIAGYDDQQNHLTAVGAGAEMWFGASSLYFAVGTLFSIFYAQFFQKHDSTHFKDTFKLNLHIAIYLMIAMSLIMYFLSNELMDLFFMSDSDANSKVSHELANHYLEILSIGNIFASISFLLLNPLIITGKTKYMLIVSVVSLFTNILFDYIFIYVLDKGSAGAAWSTSLSFGVQMLISIYLFWRNKKHFENLGNIFSFDKGVFKLIMKRLWMIITISWFSLSLVLITILWSNMYGSKMMKSMSIAYAISSIMFTIFPALNQSIKIIVGAELGKGNFELAKKYSKKVLIATLAITVVFSLVGVLCAFVLPSLFINDPFLQEQSKWMIIVYSLAMFLFIINSHTSSVLETGGLRWIPTVFNYLTQLIFVIPAQIIAGPWVLDLPFALAFGISQGIMLIPAIATSLAYLRFKWLNNINDHKDLEKEMELT